MTSAPVEMAFATVRIELPLAARHRARRLNRREPGQRGRRAANGEQDHGRKPLDLSRNIAVYLHY